MFVHVLQIEGGRNLKRFPVNAFRAFLRSNKMKRFFLLFTNLLPLLLKQILSTIHRLSMGKPRKDKEVLPTTGKCNLLTFPIYFQRNEHSMTVSRKSVLLLLSHNCIDNKITKLSPARLWKRVNGELHVLDSPSILYSYPILLPF